MKKTLISMAALMTAAMLALSGMAGFALAEECEEQFALWNEEAPADIEEDAGEAGGVQYVMYLGTNDKDTNKPVFTQEEAMEKARDILIRHFGGYTIQEAFGGWIGDDGTQYREYTLVIYLSDTTPEKIHAAADELIETFNQSSVLIQANPTQTEFYGGAQ